MKLFIILVTKPAELLCNLSLKEAAHQVLQHPTVASKKFLITIGDRSVGGLTARDQMVGPWQVPVADCAVTCSDFIGYAGEAMSKVNVLLSLSSIHLLL